MRELSVWSIAASLFFSVTLFTSSYEAATSVGQLAGIGNPGAIEQSLSGFVSRMGGEITVPKTMAEAQGRAVAVNARIDAARLQREQDWILAQGKVTALPADLSGLFGLTDGTSKYPMRAKGWQDDNDQTIHYFGVGSVSSHAIVITYKPADTSYSVNWLTDVNGRLSKTSYTDTTGTRLVPNSRYNDLFVAQFPFWDSKVPAGTSVATATASN